MACCDHENLVRFVAVCQTQPPKLITEFLPRGDALRYVRRRRDQLSSKQLLSWCHQISDGMAYLSEYKEGTKLVHRDLAARNILVVTYHFLSSPSLRTRFAWPGVVYSQECLLDFTLFAKSSWIISHIPKLGGGEIKRKKKKKVTFVFWEAVSPSSQTCHCLRWNTTLYC